jgi:hypothetical protein
MLCSSSRDCSRVSVRLLFVEVDKQMTAEQMYAAFNKAIGFTKAVPFVELPPMYRDAWVMLEHYAKKDRLFKIYDSTTVYRCKNCYQINTESIPGPMVCINLGKRYYEHDWLLMKLEPRG